MSILVCEVVYGGDRGGLRHDQIRGGGGGGELVDGGMWVVEILLSDQQVIRKKPVFGVTCPGSRYSFATLLCFLPPPTPRPVMHRSYEASSVILVCF